MKRNRPVKIVLLLSGVVFTMVLVILAMFPFLNHLFSVRVVQFETMQITQTPSENEPADVLVTAYYEMEEENSKISSIYLEVFHVGSSVVSCVEIPADTKVTLSDSLYKSLQAYAPELPQYLTLANMAEGFSKEYAPNGSNRILSEVLGITVSEFVRADKTALEAWWRLQQTEMAQDAFFDGYRTWLESSVSSRSAEEQWMYYESRQKVGKVTIETAPGSREKDGYLISGKRVRERLNELLLRSGENEGQ